jgi:ABC-type transporter Mla subunit MlaD
VSRGRRGNPIVVGAFVLGAAALAIAAVLVFGSERFFRHEVTLVSFFSGSVNGLVVGSPVKFRGVPIGSVSQIRLGVPGASEANVRIPVWYTVDLDTISGYQGRTFRLDRQRLDELIAAGLRAQLQTESFVTGVLFVGLDFFPDSPVVLELTGQPEVLEVPVMPTTIEKAIQTFDRLVKRVETLDLEGLIASARHALDGVDNLARSPKVGDALDGLREALASICRVTDALEPGVTPTMKGLDATLAQARQVLIRVEPQLDQTLARAQELLGSDAPLAVGLASTLADLSEAARSIRDLADFLDRHPNAILTGRPKP